MGIEWDLPAQHQGHGSLGCGRGGSVPPCVRCWPPLLLLPSLALDLLPPPNGPVMWWLYILYYGCRPCPSRPYCRTHPVRSP